MMPTSGFDVVQVEDGASCFAARSRRTMSRCLTLSHSISRAAGWSAGGARGHATPASAAWIGLSDHGAFIMERRMLLGIKARVEHAALPGLLYHR
jgi:hypothetical protein